MICMIVEVFKNLVVAWKPQETVDDLNKRGVSRNVNPPDPLPGTQRLDPDVSGFDTGAIYTGSVNA